MFENWHNSTKWLAGWILLSFVITGILSTLKFPMFLPYEWHKTLHVLGAVLLLGNIIVTGIWMLMAEKTKDLKIVRFGTQGVHWADVFFTAPGTILLLVNGMSMANTWGGMFTTHWILAALVLFSLSGIIWTVFLIPVQDRMIKITTNTETLSAEFYKILHRWYFWGVIATLLPLASMFLMVLKPGS